MSLLDRLRGVVKKLKIEAYKAPSRVHDKLIGSMEVIYNPESYAITYEHAYVEHQAINTTDAEESYTATAPEKVSFTLIFDETWINVFHSQSNTAKEIRKFLDLTTEINEDIHQPNYLTLTWGTLLCECHLDTVEINYVSFYPDGTPKRAEAEVAFSGEVTEPGGKAKAALAKILNSPDMTHTRIVKAGDTLPKMTEAIYGSSAYYQKVARFNHLNHLGPLSRGKKLLFPPLNQL